MILQQLLSQIAEIKPNQYSDDILIRWVSDVDGLIINEIVKWHEGCDSLAHGPYTAQDMQTKLLVDDPYSKLYMQYLSAMIDYYNGDFGRFNNDMVMYNASLSEFADWFNREHMPVQNTLFMSGV